MNQIKPEKGSNTVASLLYNTQGVMKGGWGRGGMRGGQGPRQSSGSDPIEVQFAAVPEKEKPEPQIEQTERKGIGESPPGPGQLSLIHI